MVHARNMARVQKMLHDATQKGEPVWLLRGQDMHAVPLLREYMNELEVHMPPGMNDETTEEYDSMVDLTTLFIYWQKMNGCKPPDL